MICIDDDVFRNRNQTPKTKNQLSKMVARFGETTIYYDTTTSLKALRMTWEKTYIRIPVNP